MFRAPVEVRQFEAVAARPRNAACDKVMGLSARGGNVNPGRANFDWRGADAREQIPRMDSVEIVGKKRLLRAEMRKRRALVPEAEREQAANELLKVLQTLPGIEERRDLLGVLGMGTELDPRPFCEWWIGTGRNLYIPRVQDDGKTMVACHVVNLAHCRPGYRGCPEPDLDFCQPVEFARVDMVLLPGLAFDRHGNRLGQGGGHYDRLIAGRQAGVVLVGVAYEFQVLEDLPTGPYDQHVDWIATPGGLIRCGGKR